jgi:hypothetical protein
MSTNVSLDKLYILNTVRFKKNNRVSHDHHGSVDSVSLNIAVFDNHQVSQLKEYVSLTTANLNYVKLQLHNKNH